MGRFTGTVALITGGSRGMGASHARALIAEGAKVVIGDVLVAEGEALAATLGPDCTFVKLDVTNEDDWRAAVAAAERYGPIDLLINNAGIVIWGGTEMATADFKKVIDVNLTGVFLGMKHCVPSLRKAGGGAIINVSSTAGMMGFPGVAAYVASKWGVRGMTKTAAMELGKDGIRVVSVHPGVITTPMVDGLDPATYGGQPIARAGTTDEVTKLVLYLAKDATYCTGSEFVVDGGMLLGPVPQA